MFGITASVTKNEPFGFQQKQTGDTSAENDNNKKEDVWDKGSFQPHPAGGLIIKGLSGLKGIVYFQRTLLTGAM